MLSKTIINNNEGDNIAYTNTTNMFNIGEYIWILKV